MPLAFHRREGASCVFDYDYDYDYEGKGKAEKVRCAPPRPETILYFLSP